MKDKNAITLEFDKVLSYLSSYAVSELGRERCLNAVIYDDVNTIKKETTHIVKEESEILLIHSEHQD